MKLGRDPESRSEASRRRPRRRSATTQSCTSTPTARSPRRRRSPGRERYAREWGVTWFEEPVSSGDLDGLGFVASARRSTSRPESTHTCRPTSGTCCNASTVSRPTSRGAAASAGCSRRRLRARPRTAALGALRARRFGARPLCRADAAPPGVVPRPRAHRAHVLRRLPRAGGRRAAARPVETRPRPRIQTRRRSEVRGRMSVDAKKLARDLHGTVEGEVRFDAGTRALYTTDGSNYRQVPIGVVIPKTIGRRRQDDRDLPRARRAGALARRRHEPRRPVLQRRRGDRLLEVPARHPRHRHRAEARARPAGHRARRASQRRPRRSTASPSARIRPRTTTARSAA